MSALLQAHSSFDTSQSQQNTAGKNVAGEFKLRRTELIGTFFISTETEVYDPEVPLNLSKSPTIWSPARSLESESSYSTPNLPIFNQTINDPYSLTYGRMRKESKDDPSKIFPVSFYHFLFV